MHSGKAYLALFHVWGGVLTWVSHIKRHRHAMSSATCWQSALSICANLTAALAMARSGLGGYFVQYWLVPALLGVSILGLLFSYLPHHPHEETRTESLYGCTNTVGGIFSAGTGDSTRLLTLMMLSQNYHAVHHL